MAVEIIDRLEAVVGAAHVLRSRASLVSYAVDATVGYRGEPLAAVFPGTAEETASVLQLAREIGVTVVGRGAGTSLSAGAVPPKGSIVISLSRLRRGPYIDREDLTVRAGAGVTTLEVQSAAKAAGLFYPPDPSSQDVTTMGGNAATNAGGPHALKYGVTRQYITSLEVADFSGSVVTYNRGTAGEMMVDLMIGSEGTLGLVTEVHARLVPAPEGYRTVTATFDSAQTAAHATVDLLDTGVIPGKLEFMDDVSIRAVQAARDRGLSLEIGALLLIELHGDRESLSRDGAVTLESLRNSGAENVRDAVSEGEQRRAWEARGAITSSLARLKPGKIGEDICVPRTNLPQAVDRIKKLASERDVLIALFGHIGDGTLHPNVIYEPSSKSETAAARDVLGELARIGIDSGGVLSGEHGLGLVKRDFVPYAWDWDTIRAMRRLKREFDPAGVLNPGIMWPDESERNSDLWDRG
ncbi:MAG: FAD-binding protein [Chloroflexi bacterium]|nr:FAD-binding protein [Chloroflexota bacterium]